MPVTGEIRNRKSTAIFKDQIQQDDIWRVFFEVCNGARLIRRLMYGHPHPIQMRAPQFPKFWPAFNNQNIHSNSGPTQLQSLADRCYPND